MKIEYFELNGALEYLCEVDEHLAPWIEKVGPCEATIRRYEGLFEAVSRAIIYQQLSGTVARSIFQKFEALFPAGPQPEIAVEIEHDTFRSAGLSNAKARAVRDLAQKMQEGAIPSMDEINHLEDEKVVEILCQVKGVGRWTANMFLMFNLGRIDVLPSADLGIRKGFQKIKGLNELPEVNHLSEYGKRWSPYRTIASWYLWRVLEID